MGEPQQKYKIWNSRKTSTDESEMKFIMLIMMSN